HQFDVLQAESAERRTSADKLRTEIEISSACVLRGEEEILQLRQRFTEVEHEISASLQQALELKAQSDHHESRIHFNEERPRDLEQQPLGARADIAEAERRPRAAQQDLAGVAERLAASTATMDLQRATLEEKHQALRQLESELHRRQEALRQAQSDAFA